MECVRAVLQENVEQASWKLGSPDPGRAYRAGTIGVPLTGTQSLGLKSGQVMLEIEEMSCLLNCMQLKKVHLSLGFLWMSPGCRYNTDRIKISKCTPEASPGRPGVYSFTDRRLAHRFRVTGQVTTHKRVLETEIYQPMVT